MASEVTIPDKVMEALIENTKVINANTEIIAKNNDNSEKIAKKEENLVQNPSIDSSLTNDEKMRYKNIGKELFAPVLISLEKLLNKEKRRNEMLIKDDVETVNDSIKVQYETESENKAEDENESWLKRILNILTIAGIAVTLFHDKIIEFFTKAWDWIKDMFFSIGNFFDFNNKDNPINKILNTCGSALNGLWDFVKNTFNKIGNFGSIIWDGIKSGWDKFITGPDGILSFGSKVVKGIVNFASNSISWIGEAIYGTIMEPLTSIFGDAKEDGKKAGEEAVNDVKASVSQIITDETIKSKAIKDNAIFSAERADAAIIETAKITRENAIKQAKEQGLILDKNKVTDESLKEVAAKAGLDAFLEANDISMDDTNGKYDEIKEEFMKHVSISDNKAEINMENLKNALEKKANEESNFFAPDGKFINALQALDDNEGAEKINEINDNVTTALQKGLQISADMQAAANLENMSEEERFETRLLEAMKQGKSAEFRFMEGRKMILQSVENIKSIFASYDEQIRTNFTSTWTSFMTDFAQAIKIKIETDSPQDNSNNTYNIMPLHKQSFMEMNDKMLKLAQENTTILIQQNKTLDAIAKLLSESTTAEKKEVVIQNNTSEDSKKNKGSNNIMLGAKGLSNNLLRSSSLWI